MIRSATTRLTVAATAMLAAGLLTMPSAVAARTAGNAFGATGSGGTWASAVEVPGLAALNVNGVRQRQLGVSVMWPSGPGALPSVVHLGRLPRRRRGTTPTAATTGRRSWSAGAAAPGQTAAQVPGLAALNTGQEAQVTLVSCTSAGNCAAGSEYLDNRGHARPFVVSERDGVWGTGLQVPGSASLNPHARAMVVSSVSCASAGNCAAGGWYTEGVDRDLVFVVTQRNGVWGTAMRAPGIASLDAGNAFLSSVSCVSAGTCAAGGFYTDASRHSQPFVVDERKGVWGRVMPVPGSAAVNTGGYAGTNSVSCASAGACVAVGWSSGPRRHAFVARERKGTWGKAIPVPGLAALNNGGGSYATSVSCASAGNCAAGGWYKYGARSGHWQAFVVGLVNGRWAKGQAGAGFGHPEHRRAGPARLGVVLLGRQLRRGRVLHHWLRSPPGVRRQRAQRGVGQGHPGAGPGDPERGRVRRPHLGVVRTGGICAAGGQ
jgi:hypothetical protein